MNLDDPVDVLSELEPDAVDTSLDTEETHSDIYDVQTRAAGPNGALPLTADNLLNSPSGDVFGLTQNAGMGWRVEEVMRPPFLILSTQGGLRERDGRPVALGYHTGHWELDELVRVAARTLDAAGALPFAGYCSDPCDGRTQGTTGMFDSLPYRNDAAVVLRRLIRSLPRGRGVLGVATCDKGLPAMMMALAGTPHLPVVVVPGGVTLPPERGEDAGKVQTLGARFAHGLVTLEEAATLGCRACATTGGGCQFLGTAATAQVVAEALGLAVPHAALAPSGSAVWRDGARRSAEALLAQEKRGLTGREVLTPKSLHNAMVVHAAFGGSTNLLLHLPAIAHAAGLARPLVKDWQEVNRRTPRLVSVLPNGPVDHPTVRVFLAGGVPEVMLHLRELGGLELDALTATGETLDEALDAWEASERRRRFKEVLWEHDGVRADEVILSPDKAEALGMMGTVSFLTGNLAPEGAIVKSTAIDPALFEGGVYYKEGRARVFTREGGAMQAIKEGRITVGDVMVLAGVGPAGTGMEETYQVTSALKHLPFGGSVALVTDARFSGVSTGACVGHVGPEGLAGGPIGRVQDDDWIRITVDPRACAGTLDLVGEGDERFSADEGARRLRARPPHPDLSPDPRLPDDTRLWAALQAVSGGTWGGCVYDAARIEALLARGVAAEAAKN